VRKFVNLFYDVRKSEWMTAGLMFLLNAMLMATLYFLKPARDSLFLSKVGPEQLPFVYLLLAAVAVPVSIIMSKYLQEYTSRKVLQGSLLLFIGSLLTLRWIFTLQVEWIYTVFYIWVGIFGILVISQFWLYANALFNTAQSKRLFSFLNLGAILGAIAGSQASSILVAWINLSTENLLMVGAALLAFSCIITVFIHDLETDEETDENKREVDKDSSIAYSTRDVFKTVFSSRYQLLIAGVIGFAMLVSTLVDYQFKSVASDMYTSTASLTSFMGSFYSGLSVVSLLIQILLSAQIIKRLGLGGAILSRPASILMGSVLFLYEPVLAVAVYMQGFDRATRYSIDKTGRELLFLPLPQSVKRKTKIFMDIFVDRLFRGLAGLLLLGFIYWRDFTVEQISYVVIAAIGVWILLGFWARKEYVKKFRDSLRKRYIDEDQISLNLDEPVVYRSIKEMLESGDNSRIIYALIMLKDSRPAKVTAELQRLLENDRSEIRLRVLELLQKIESANATDQVKKLLNDNDPEVRLEAVNYLCQHSEEPPQNVMRAYLEHEDENLKYAALGCMHRHGGEMASEIDNELIEEVLQRDDKESVVLKAQIAQVLGYLPDHPKGKQYLCTLLAQQEQIVVGKALQSIQQLRDKGFIEELINKIKDPDYTLQVQKVLASYGDECFDTFKEIFFDASKELEIREQIPGVFIEEPKQGSVNYLLEMLDESNPRLRYKVIKALNKLKKKKGRLNYHKMKIQNALEAESRTYFELLSMKMVQRTDIPNNILIISLKEKMDQATERLFRLAGLMHDQQDIYGSYLALRSSDEDAQAASVEFVDNVLKTEEKKYITPIIDTLDEEEKMAKGRKLFEIPVEDYEEAMLNLMEGEDIWLRACAIFSVSATCPDSLQDHVKQSAAGDEYSELVQETATYVLERNSED
jgi:ATP/ADP translocase/HEAT repeat protein